MKKKNLLQQGRFAADIHYFYVEDTNITALFGAKSPEISTGYFFFSSRRRHTRLTCDWSSDVCSSDLALRRRHRAQREQPERGLGAREPTRRRAHAGAA